MQRIEIKDFSGGIVSHNFTSDPSTCEIGDNLLIDKDRSLYSRPGSEFYDSSNPLPSWAITRVNGLTEFNDDLIAHAGSQMRVHNGSNWTSLSGIVNDSVIENGNLNSRISTDIWNGHLIASSDDGSKPIKIYKDNNGNYQVRTMGLPLMSSNPTITPNSAGGKNYIYYFCYYYEYFVGNTFFIDIGPTLKIATTNMADLDTGWNNIASIPQLVNTGNESYDVANIKIRIYRTKHDGTSAYLVGEINNGTTSYQDSLSDIGLELNEIIYTAGGAPENDPPPISKYIVVCNSSTWYGNIEGKPYRLLQSIQSDPDSVPPNYFIDFDEDIVGLTSYQNTPIVFTNNQVWRVEGIVTNTGGSLRKVLISDKIGCLSNSSIVQTWDGVFWSGNDGFYFTDSYKFSKIPRDEKNINSLYLKFTGNTNVEKNIVGAYDRFNRRVFWAVQMGSDNDTIIIYDEAFNSFMTWSDPLGDSFNPTSIYVRNGDLIRGDSRGYIFQHKERLLTDLRVNESLTPSQFTTQAIVWKWRHILFDFGFSDLIKWVTRVTLSGRGTTNLGISIKSHDNQISTGKLLKEIDFKAGLVWGDGNWIWEDPQTIWEITPTFSKTRRMPRGKLRTKTKALEISNYNGQIAVSTPTSRGIVNSTNSTVIIENYPSNTWPFNPENQKITINQAEYEILSATDQELTLSDPSNSLINGTFDWVISGYEKEQKLELNSIVYEFELAEFKDDLYKAGEN